MEDLPARSGLHLQHFPGRCASSVLPFVQWSRPPGTARTDLLAALGIPENIEVGDRVEVDVGAGPSFGGMVADVAPRRLALVLDEPAPGTAFVTSEGRASADSATVSVWAYLYGPDAAVVAARTFPRWRCWLRELPDTAS